GVAGDREVVDLVGQGLGAAGREVEALELAGRFLVAAAAVRADDVLRAPDDLGAGDAGDAAIASLGHRKGGDAVSDAVDVDPHGLDRGTGLRLLGAVAISVLAPGLRADAARVGREGRSPAGLLRGAVVARDAWGADVEADVVVV